MESTPEIVEIVEAFDLNFLLGNAVNCICIHEDRNGIEDLEEAMKCLKREIENQEKSGANKFLPKNPELDNVNPGHYRTAAGFQVINVIEAYDLNFPLGNAIKYICRHKGKNGLEDLKKAQWYLNREIENQLAPRS